MRRVIFLVDMNAFFISCEITRNPALLGKPAAVAGSPERRAGIILAANYEARKYGVKTAMVLHEALRLCPEMLLVPPDHEFYEKMSREVMELLGNYTPLIEQNSIDEAWLDMTGSEGLFGEPQESAHKIMDDIKNNLGLWCSIGISENKFLSKMASDMKKPMGITELWPDEIQAKLWPLPVGATYGIGKKTSIKLNSIGIETIGDLAKLDKDLVISVLGKAGIMLHQYVNGIDPSPVASHTGNGVKSIGRSTTLSHDVSDFEEAKAVLVKLADEIGVSARRHGKKGRTVQITIKYSDFQTITRQTTVPATYLTKDITCAGTELLEKNWNKNRRVRLLGISLSGFDEDCDTDQLSLFEPQTLHGTAALQPQNSDKEEKIEKTIDSIRSKFGNTKIKRASLLDKEH